MIGFIGFIEFIVLIEFVGLIGLVELMRKIMVINSTELSRIFGGSGFQPQIEVPGCRFRLFQ
jgi:hypothetical protein